MGLTLRMKGLVTGHCAHSIQRSVCKAPRISSHLSEHFLGVGFGVCLAHSVSCKSRLVDAALILGPLYPASYRSVCGMPPTVKQSDLYLHSYVHFNIVLITKGGL
jgi:hypothetical protein